MILLSVCIPTYQRPDLLERALASVVASGAPADGSVEIVVSDNSTDDLSAEAYHRSLAGWPGVRRYVQNRPSLPMISNFNQCIALAEGRFVLILHDDDYLLPGAWDAIRSAIATSDDRDRVLLFGVDVVNEAGVSLRRQEFARDRYLAPARALVRLLGNSSFVRFPAIVVRRDAFEEVGVFDGRLGNPTDLDMWIRLFASFGVRSLPATTSAYSIHEEALTTGMFHARTIGVLAGIFDRAVRTGVLPEPVVRHCQVDWVHQFILAGAYRRLRIADRAGARRILGLFDLSLVRSLGMSRRWAPVRLAMAVLASLPSAVSVRIVRGIGRFDPDHRFLTAR